MSTAHAVKVSRCWLQLLFAEVYRGEAFSKEAKSAVKRSCGVSFWFTVLHHL
jgi:hypothetical protein